MSRVLEVDPGVVELDRTSSGARSAELEVRVGDARVGLRDEPRGERDLVVGDAFGGLSVPWQLTTGRCCGWSTAPWSTAASTR